MTRWNSRGGYAGVESGRVLGCGFGRSGKEALRGLGSGLTVSNGCDSCEGDGLVAA